VDEDPSHSQLQVPQFERNMLISPPGSPFDDWKQIAEDPPNQSVLASDMMHAADVSDYELDDDELDLDNSNDSSPVLEEPPQMKTRESTTRFTIVCAKGTDTPDHLPAITVQDWDGQVNIQVDEDDNQLGTGQIARTKKSIKDLKPTSMPPQ
jgi:hypothetical protein